MARAAKKQVASIVSLDENPAAGLAQVIAIDTATKSLVADRLERLKDLKPKLSVAFAVSARNVQQMPSLKKTITLRDGNASADIQLRSKPSKGTIAPEDVAILTKARIPLKLSPATLVINSKYSVSDDETAFVIARLAKLVTDHPEAGIPMDLFDRTEPRHVPAEDAILRALHLPFPQVHGVLSIIADTVITKGNGEGSDVSNVLTRIAKQFE